jgi:hypothetical protein
VSRSVRPFSSQFVLRSEKKDVSGQFPPKYSRYPHLTVFSAFQINI